MGEQKNSSFLILEAKVNKLQAQLFFRQICMRGPRGDKNRGKVKHLFPWQLTKPNLLMKAE